MDMDLYVKELIKRSMLSLKTIDFIILFKTIHIFMFSKERLRDILYLY